MKERLKKLGWIVLAVYLVFIISFFGFFIFKEPTLTGFVLYEEAVNTLNWTFDDANDYAYDDSLIEIDDGIAQLVSITTYTYWNTSAGTDYSVTSVLYNPNDKTEKVNSLDNKKHEVNGEKIFDIFFAEELDNNDIVSLFLEGDNEAEIYLCERGTVCNAPNYGSINFNGSEDWRNITIDNLESATNIISIVSSGEVKFNYITSTKGDITQALYNPDDKISQIENIDNKKIQINKNKLFNVIFDNKVNNGDIISLYLKNSDEAADIYICDYGEFCSSGYGSVNFDGNEGWYSITITNLDKPKDGFNINPSEDIKLDYIKAAHIDITTHSLTNISYPESASIETNDIDITGLASFLNFYKNDLLNGQNINYYYSIDSGNNWYDIPSDYNLSGIDTTNKKIRIKAELSSDGSATPTIYDFSVKYETQICNENWNLTYGGCLSSNTKLKYYIDKNECGTINNLPANNGSYEVCDYCTPNWSCVSYGECELNNFKKCIAVEDANFCYNLTNSNSDAYSGDYNEFDLSCVYNKTGTGFSNLSISAIANEKVIINKINSTDIVLELNASNNLENNFISIIKYYENKKNASPSLSALNKYLDIEANNSLKKSINSVKIKVYYTDEELNNADLDENTLKIYYYNETSNQWQVLNSSVNSSGNYVEVIIDHLSTFGIFGEQREEISETSESSSSSGSGSGGGGGVTRRIPKTITKPAEAEKIEALPEKEEKAEEKTEKPKIEEECDYKISVSLPEHVSLIESEYVKGIIKNVGNCKIENLNIDTSPELKDVISIENKRIENIDANESAEFSLIKKLETSKAKNLLIQGFNIKIPKENIKTYSGSLIVGAIVQEQLAFEEKVNVKVDLLETPSIISIVGSKVPIFTVIFFLLAIIVFYIKRRVKPKYPYSTEIRHP